MNCIYSEYTTYEALLAAGKVEEGTRSYGTCDECDEEYDEETWRCKGCRTTVRAKGYRCSCGDYERYDDKSSDIWHGGQVWCPYIEEDPFDLRDRGLTNTYNNYDEDCEDCGAREVCDFTACNACGIVIIEYDLACDCVHSFDERTVATRGASYHGIAKNCQHGRASSHAAIDTFVCSSSHRCSMSKHSSYSTINHYYCTTHNYVGTSATCPGLTLNPSPSPLTLYYGQTSTLSANANPSSASVSFASADSSVATVTSSGQVTGKRKGNTQITVTGVI